MPVTAADVRALAPGGEFSDPPVTDAMIDAAIAGATFSLATADAWRSESQYDYALSLASAHVLARRLGGAAGPAGPVTSEKDGAVSRAFGMLSGGKSHAWWSSTTWGQELLALISALTNTPMAANTTGGVHYAR